jgi:hypothetical protein
MRIYRVLVCSRVVENKILTYLIDSNQASYLDPPSALAPVHWLDKAEKAQRPVVIEPQTLSAKNQDH